MVRGDARRARWTFDVTVRRDDAGSLDLGGPFVYGTVGARAIGLRWGTMTEHDEFEVFRAAKLRCSDIDPALLEQALKEVVRSWPPSGSPTPTATRIRASVRPPDVVWSTE